MNQPAYINAADMAHGRVVGHLHKVILWLTWAFLFLNPFPYIESVKEICFYTAVALFAGLAVTRKARYRLMTPILPPLLAYTAWALVGVAFALDRSRSFHDLLSHLVKYLGLYLIVINYWGDRRQFLRLVWTFVIAAVLAYSVMMVHYYGVLGEPLWQRLGVGYTKVSVNVMGYTTLFAALLIFHLIQITERPRWLRLALYYGLAVSLAGSILPQSRGTLLAMLAASILITRRKSIVLVLLVVTIATVMLTPFRERILSHHAYEDRIFRIYYSWELFKDHPVTGTGFSLDALKDPAVIDDAAYRARLPESYRDYYQEFILPHSMLLNVPVRTGLPGAVLLAWVFVQFALTGRRLSRAENEPWIRGWNRTVTACMVMYLVKAAFEPVDTAPVEVIFFTILAMQTILWMLAAAPIKEKAAAMKRGGGA